MKQNLSEILKDPSEEFLNPLFPDEMHWKKPATGSHESFLAVQVNYFECGGTAISVCLSHKVAEASSLCHFVKDWASITTKSSQVTLPHFNGASVFPWLTYRFFRKMKLRKVNQIWYRKGFY